jgi:hypothetical protein
MTSGDPLKTNQPATAGAPVQDQSAAQEKAAADRLFLIVAKDLGGGKSKESIITKLTGMGITPLDAATFTDKVKTEVDRIRENEKVTATAYMPAVFGALAAAVIGGIVWGWIAVSTNHEYGYVALGIGFVCGYGAVLLSGKKKGTALQVIACLMSLLGIVVGKYYFFVSEYIKALSEKFGPEAVKGMGAFTPSVAVDFITNIRYSFGGYDILWIILAISVAWSIPQSSLKQIKVK